MKVGEKEARFIIDNHKTMRQVDIAKKLGVTSSVISNFTIEFIEGRTPEEALDFFIRCSKKTKGCAWTEEEEQILIDNFNAEPRELQKLIDRKFRSIRGKQRDLVGKAKRDQLPPEQVKKILAAISESRVTNIGIASKREKEELRRQQEQAKVEDQLKKAIARGVFRERAPVEIKLPKLELGAKYTIWSETPISGRSKLNRRGKAIKHYPNGSFYLFDFGAYRETISQIDLLTGDVEARWC